MSDSYHWWKVQHLSAPRWQRIKVALALAGIFFAGFCAWKDEHTQVTQKQAEIDRLDRMGGGGKEVQAKIDGLTQTNQWLEKEVTRLREQLGPWILTGDQRKKIIEEVSKVPPGEIYALGVHVIPGCSLCSGYADDLIRVWGNIPGWKVNGTTHLGLDPQLTGVTFVFDPATCPSGEIQLVEKAFDAAGIKHSTFSLSEKDKKSIRVACGIFVGNRDLE